LQKELTTTKGKGKNKTTVTTMNLEAPLDSSRSRFRNIDSGKVIGHGKEGYHKDLGSVSEQNKRMREDNTDGSMEQKYIEYKGKRFLALFCKLCKCHANANKPKFEVGTPIILARNIMQ